MELLSESQIAERLTKVPQWKYVAGEIERLREFRDFSAAMDFVNSVAKRAEKANHHPDIDIRWNKVTLRLSTHSKGGLTDADFRLAEEIERIG